MLEAARQVRANKEKREHTSYAKRELELTDKYRCTEAFPLPHCPACGSIARPNLWFCTDQYAPARTGNFDGRSLHTCVPY